MQRIVMKKHKKEEVADDYCFVRKDGGELRICDYRSCRWLRRVKAERKDVGFSVVFDLNFLKLNFAKAPNVISGGFLLLMKGKKAKDQR
ncbi:hypothetical protein QQ045_009171 [Rhodiola kirilowii]